MKVTPMEYEDEVLAFFRKAVVAEVNELKQAKQPILEKEIQKLLKKNFEKVESSQICRYAVDGKVPPLELSNARLPPEHALHIAVRKDKKTGTTVEIPALILEDVEPLPLMHHWAPLHQNYLVEDECILPNIPYLGDNSTDREGRFLQDLLKSYEHVHGTAPAGKDDSLLLTDSMYCELVISLWKKYGDRIPKKQGDSPEKTDCGWPLASDGPSRVIFKAVQQQFPDLGTEQDLYQKFLDYQARTCLDKSQKFYPNVDSPNAASIQRDQTMHTFHSLFCRRCYTYDCFLHSHSHTGPPARSWKSDIPESPSPCSTDCYKSKYSDLRTKLFADNENSNDSFASVVESSEKREFGKLTVQRKTSDTSTSSGSSAPVKLKKRKRAHSSLEKDKINAKLIKLEVDITEPTTPKSSPTKALAAMHKEDQAVYEFDLEMGKWSGGEESFFRVAYSIFKTDFCTIAKCLKTKTCKQVFLFAKKEKELSGLEVDHGVDLTPPIKRHGAKWLQNLSKCHSIHEQRAESSQDGNKRPNAYVPCKHLGNCSENHPDCSCFDRGTFCEKFCQCSRQCRNRFPGCRCKAQCSTRACPCFIAKRECDPDLCTTCGAAEFDKEEVQCRNCQLQRGVRKHLLLAPSDIAGWGIFAKTVIHKGELVSEYCGEVISQEETERRGKLYDQYACSFLFDLNQDYVVDATRKGNKIRFANHSVNPNCEGRVMLVNGDHRIGIFAKKDIAEGDELFFDYRYGPNYLLKFVNLERLGDKYLNVRDLSVSKAHAFQSPSQEKSPNPGTSGTAAKISNNNMKKTCTESSSASTRIANGMRMPRNSLPASVNRALRYEGEKEKTPEKTRKYQAVDLPTNGYYKNKAAATTHTIKTEPFVEESDSTDEISLPSLSLIGSRPRGAAKAPPIVDLGRTSTSVSASLRPESRSSKRLAMNGLASKRSSVSSSSQAGEHQFKQPLSLNTRSGGGRPAINGSRKQQGFGF